MTEPPKESNTDALILAVLEGVLCALFILFVLCALATWTKLAEDRDDDRARLARSRRHAKTA